MNCRSRIMRLLNLALMLFLVVSCGTVLDPKDLHMGQESQINSNEVRTNPYFNATTRVDSTVNEDFSLALEHIRHQRLDEAKIILLSLHGHHKGLSGPVVNLGIIFEKQEKNELAEHYFRKAIEINPVNLAAYNRYALHLRRAGRFLEAEEQYKMALDVWSSDIDTHRNLAFLYELYMGRLEDALLHYRNYLALLKADLVPLHRQGAKTPTENDIIENNIIENKGENTRSEISKKIKLANNWIIDLERRVNKGQGL